MNAAGSRVVSATVSQIIRIGSIGLSRRRDCPAGSGRGWLGAALRSGPGWLSSSLACCGRSAVSWRSSPQVLAANAAVVRSSNSAMVSRPVL